MIVLSHRGLWKRAEEKNTESAFRRSFASGFGTETDVRDAVGQLVIAHDMPCGGEMSLDDYLELPNATALLQAINIKADGLATALHNAAKRHALRDWFVFDMSVPDMRSHLSAGNPVFTRMSEVEREPVWLEEAAGVWLDSFSNDWYSASVIDNLLARKKRVCVVSCELHGRPHDGLWNLLLRYRENDRVILCTDLPDRARAHFGS